MIRRVVLTVKEGPAAPQEASYLAPCELLIGRGTEVHLPMDLDLRISRQHARLSVGPTTAVLCDMGSRYGTLLNGTEIAGKGDHPLQHLDRIYAGRSVVLVRLLDSLDPDYYEARASPRAGIRVEDTDTVTGEADGEPYTRSRFEVFGEPLGSGGWGTVYQARDRITGRVVALKELSAQGADAQRLLVRFLHERWIHQHLKHRHIVRSIAGWEAPPSGYHVMEFVDGVHLNRYRRRHGERRQGPRGPVIVLPTRLVLQLARQLLDALEYAHTFAHNEGKGCLHRDVKPQNVIVAGQGEQATVKLTDFGLGRLEGSTLEGFTQVGEAFGTWCYLPPEQLDGFRHLTDRRSDLFGLGATLYEALTGKSVYAFERHPDPRVVVENRQTVEASYSGPWLTPAVYEFLDRAAHPIPACRFQTAAEMLAAVEALESAR